MNDDECDIWELFNDLRVTEDSAAAAAPAGLLPAGSGSSGSSGAASAAHVTCERCAGGSDMVLDESLWVCRRCGSVVSRYLDMTPEWRTFSDPDGRPAGDALRCGAPAHPLLPHSSLGIYIGYSVGSEAPQMRIVRKLHMWSNLTYRERMLFHVFDTLTVNAANNGIPKTILEQAKVYYKQLSEMQVSRGENRHGLIASSIYMACKQQGVPRSIKEIAKIFNIKPTTMAKSCKRLMDLLRVPAEASTPVDFIARFGCRIGLSAELRAIAQHVAQEINRLDVTCDSTPPSIAAAVIYLVGVLCSGGFTKKDLAEACEISQVTIGKCFKRLHAYRLHLLPGDAIERFGIK